MKLHLVQLFTYPLKSGAAVAHQAVALDDFGLAWDRRWMVVTPDGEFVSQRSHRRLALVQATVGSHRLHLGAPGTPGLEIPLDHSHDVLRSVTVWRDSVLAWDEGDGPADWLSQLLGTPVRLMRFPEHVLRRVDPQRVPTPAHTAFADGYPILLATEPSRAELNRRLLDRGRQPVPMSRFRPNLVLDGDGLAAFAEDGWRRIRIGAVEFEVVKPCTRCGMTTTDQVTGTIPEPGEPLATLATFRRWEGEVIFAQNLVHRGSGVLRVGDPVTVLEAA